MPLGENSTLKIGQIIYVLSNKAQKIIPAIVVEEMTVKKLEGNEVSWKVSVGPTGKEKIIDSKRLDGELYETLLEVENVLKQRLEAFVNGIVVDAQKRAEIWYGNKPKLVQQSATQDKIDPDTLIEEETSMLQDIKKKSGLSHAQTSKEVRNKLLAALSDEQNTSTDIMEQEEIQLPDGQVVKVNIRT